MHGLLVDHGVEGNQLVNVNGVANRKADQVIDIDEARRPLPMHAMRIIVTRCTAWYIVRSRAAVHGQQRLLPCRLLGRQPVNDVDEVAVTGMEAQQTTKVYGPLARNQWHGFFGRAPSACCKPKQSRQRCCRCGRQRFQHRGVRFAVERLSAWQSNSLIDPIVVVAAIITLRSACTCSTNLCDGMHLLVILTLTETQATDQPSQRGHRRRLWPHGGVHTAPARPRPRHACEIVGLDLCGERLGATEWREMQDLRRMHPPLLATCLLRGDGSLESMGPDFACKVLWEASAPRFVE
mmetsp:Transcript_130883/g.419738  ORF Transcript_130883/g.419738 Transcript_130883/m.419738 type:complete len:294 (+) Transcript_130883:491-1372(+)